LLLEVADQNGGYSRGWMTLLRTLCRCVR